MNSWGVTTDEWRGFAPLSTHTICFKTAYGIPDLCAAYEKNAIPAAQRRELDEGEHAKQVAALHTIHRHFEHFSDDNLADCLDMLGAYTAPPRPFDWDGEDIKNLYGGGVGAGQSVQAAAQHRLGLPTAKLDGLYLCKPFEEDTDTFLLGIVKRLTKDAQGWSGVNMQWFTLVDDAACRYTGKYKPVLKTNLRYVHTLY